MSYKKSRVKKKYLFECEECGDVQERTKDIAPKSCSFCKRQKESDDAQKKYDQVWVDIGVFTKKNNLRESDCCETCKNSISEEDYYGEDDTYKCRGVPTTKFGDKPGFIVERTDCCDAFERKEG